MGYLRDFKNIVKRHSFDLRPDGGLNGTETFIFPNETAADEYVCKVTDCGKQVNKYSNLEITSRCSDPIGEKMNLEEGSAKYVKKRKLQSNCFPVGPRVELPPGSEAEAEAEAEAESEAESGAKEEDELPPSPEEPDADKEELRSRKV